MQVYAIQVIKRQVNDTSKVAGIKIVPDDIKKLLRGPGGTNVKVTVQRDNQQMDFIIQRGIIPVPSVDAAYMITPAAGFIHINKFAETTYEEFMMSLEKLNKQGMIVLNSLNDKGAGFGYDTNKITIFDKSGQQFVFDTKSKTAVACDIVDTITKLYYV